MTGEPKSNERGHAKIREFNRDKMSTHEHIEAMQREEPQNLGIVRSWKDAHQISSLVKSAARLSHKQRGVVRLRCPLGNFLLIKQAEVTTRYTNSRQGGIVSGQIHDVMEDTLVVVTENHHLLVTLLELDGSRLCAERMRMYQLKPGSVLPSFSVSPSYVVTSLLDKEEFWTTMIANYDPTMMPVQKLMWKPTRAKKPEAEIAPVTETVHLPRLPFRETSYSETEYNFAIFVTFLGRMCCSSDVQIGIVADKSGIPEMLQDLYSDINASLFQLKYSSELEETLKSNIGIFKQFQEAKAFLNDTFHRYSGLENMKRKPFHNIVVGILDDSNHQEIDASSYLADANVMVLLHKDKMVFVTQEGAQEATKQTVEALKRFPIFRESVYTHDGSDKVLDISLLSHEEIEHYQSPQCNGSQPVEEEKEVDLLDDFWKFYEDAPDHLALITTGLKLTYRQLGDEINRLSGMLSQSLPKEAGSRCLAVHLPNSSGYVVSILTAVSMGRPFMPVPSELPADRLSFVLKDSKCSLMLTSQDIYEKDMFKELPQSKLITHINTLFGDLVLVEFVNLKGESSDGKTFETWELHEDCCYVIYTSGSTGKPKGVQCTTRGVLNLARAQIQLWDLGPSDITAQFASIGFDAAMSEVFTALLSGGTLAVLQPHERLGKELVNTLGKLAVTTITFPPSLLNIYEPQDFPSLKKVITAGEACTLTMAKKWTDKSTDSKRFFNAYGPAENTVCATNYEFLPQISQDRDSQELPIGQAIPGTRVYVFDEFQKPVPSGVVGEIYVGGKSLSAGYIGHAESKNKERFVKNPLVGEELFYRTGDHAIRDMNGDLTFLGRLDNQVKLRGQMVNLNEVEQILLQHAEVDMAVVVKHQGSNMADPFIAAYVSPATLSASDLRGHLSKSLPKYMIPSVIRVMREDDFPLNLSGKVDRRELEHDECTRDTETVSTYSSFSETELAIARIWCNALKIDVKNAYTMHKHSSFIALGGNSIRLIVLQKNIEKEFQVRLSFEEVSKSDTIEELFKAIRSKQGYADEPAPLNSSKSTASLRQDMLKDSILELKEIPKKVLLSGATGFLGAFLLYELLEQTNANVWCMVRESTGEKAYAKLVANMRKYDLWRDGFEIRIAPVLSDIAKPKLGMSPNVYRDLSNCIDTVFMNAAKMNFNTSYQDHKDGNVDGTKEFIKFCTEGKRKYIFSTSSLGVLLFPPKDEVEEMKRQGKRVLYKEDEMLEDPLHVVNGYGQSKWVSEQLIIQALEKVPGGAIFRPARVSGHSKTGAGPRNDLFAAMMTGIEKIGAVPDVDFPFDLTPVDFCAKAMVEVMTQVCQDTAREMPRVYHLFNNATLPFQGLFDGLSLTKVPMKEWRRALWDLEDNDNPLVPLTEFFYSEFWDRVNDWPDFDTTNTNQYISEDCRQLLLPSHTLIKVYRNFFSQATPDTQSPRRRNHLTKPV